MAPNTAQAAVRMLAIEGLVEIRPARGVDARDNTRDSDDQTLRAQLADLGVSLRRGKDQLAAAESMVAVLLSRLPSEERIR
jgi:hypothetical protein